MSRALTAAANMMEWAFHPLRPTSGLLLFEAPKAGAGRTCEGNIEVGVVSSRVEGRGACSDGGSTDFQWVQACCAQQGLQQGLDRWGVDRSRCKLAQERVDNTAKRCNLLEGCNL